VAAANGRGGREWSAAREGEDRKGREGAAKEWEGRLGLERRGASNPPDAKSMTHNPNSPLSSRPERMNAKILPFI
jgi:hypothetical protein